MINGKDCTAISNYTSSQTCYLCGRKETGMLVDVPKPNSGNYNDGNTARRFFRDVAKTAEITQTDMELIEWI